MRSNPLVVFSKITLSSSPSSTASELAGRGPLIEEPLNLNRDNSMETERPPTLTEQDVEDLLSGVYFRRNIALARWNATSALFASTLVIGFAPLLLRLIFSRRATGKFCRFLRSPHFTEPIVAVTTYVTAGHLLALVFSKLFASMRTYVSDDEILGSGTDIAAGFFVTLVFNELVSIRFGCDNKEHPDRWHAHIVRFIRSELRIGDRDIAEQPGPSPDAGPEREQEKDSSDDPGRCVTRPHMNFVVYFGVTMLSLDSMLEGLSLGLQPSLDDTWLVFASFLAYRVPIVLLTSAQLTAMNFPSKQIVIVIFMISIMHPAGCLFGNSFHQSGVTPRNQGLLLGISAGKLLYVIFFDLLLKGSKTKYSRRLTQLASTSMGFLIFAHTVLYKERK